jgi:hypothetical protein
MLHTWATPGFLFLTILLRFLGCVSESEEVTFVVGHLGNWRCVILYLSILLHYFTYNNTTTVTMQLIKLICIFSFLFS